MDNVKLSVTIEIPGATMYPEESNNYINVATTRGKNPIKVKIRNSINARQHLSMTKEAYQNMISDTPINRMLLKDWKKLTKMERINKHLEDIMHDFHGSSYTFHIFED